MLITIITAAIIAIIVFVWACCRVSSESYPCKACKKKTCTECRYWKEMTGDE